MVWRIALGSMKRTSSWTTSSSPTSVVPRERKNSTSRWTRPSGALAPEALVPQRIVRRSWRDGAVVGERPLGDAVAARYRSPFWHVHRPTCTPR